VKVYSPVLFIQRAAYRHSRSRLPHDHIFFCHGSSAGVSESMSCAHGLHCHLRKLMKKIGLIARIRHDHTRVHPPVLHDERHGKHQEKWRESIFYVLKERKAQASALKAMLQAKHDHSRVHPLYFMTKDIENTKKSVHETIANVLKERKAQASALKTMLPAKEMSAWSHKNSICPFYCIQMELDMFHRTNSQEAMLHIREKLFRTTRRSTRGAARGARTPCATSRGR
jgi:hypothetical protein